MTNALNAVGLVLAFILAVVVSIFPRRDVGSSVPPTPGALSPLQVVTLPSGKSALQDADGIAVELLDYQRIASGSTISDALLLEFISPERIVSFTNYSHRAEFTGHRFLGKPRLDTLNNMEGLLALHPDLLFVSSLSSSPHVQRLRDLGLTVFSLGEMRGVMSFLRNVQAISILVGRPELGARYAETFRKRLLRIAHGVPQEGRRRGAYMTFYGGKIFGAGANTSYHDVLTFAGLLDAGAEDYEGWPALTPEQVLVMDPEVVVTRSGLAAQFCTTPALNLMRACSAQGRFVEVPEELLNDPGPGMLPAAEAIFEALHADPAR